MGEWWLPRRKGFLVAHWRAQCKCNHGHDAHDPAGIRRCLQGCGCPGFRSAFACVACDRPWEDHETLEEDARERQSAGRPTGDAFRPLASTPDLRSMVFGPQGGGQAPRAGALEHRTEEESLSALAALHVGGATGGRPGLPSSSAAGSLAAPPRGASLRPAHVSRPEKSVRLMARDQGGRGQGKPTSD